MGWDGMDGMGWDAFGVGLCQLPVLGRKALPGMPATGCFLTIECPIPPSSRWDDFYAQDEWLG